MRGRKYVLKIDFAISKMSATHQWSLRTHKGKLLMKGFGAIP
jgi:hypothetical protein